MILTKAHVLRLPWNHYLEDLITGSNPLGDFCPHSWHTARFILQIHYSIQNFGLYQKILLIIIIIALTLQEWMHKAAEGL